MKQSVLIFYYVLQSLHVSSNDRIVVLTIPLSPVVTERGATSGNVLCQLQDHNHDAMATEPERGTSVQRLWVILQTT